MRISKGETGALLIDVQEKLFPFIAENEVLARHLEKLISGLNALQVPFFATEQYTRGLGVTLNRFSSLRSDWQPIEKMTFSCAGSNELMKSLESNKFKNLILFGIEAHICVLQSAIDFKELGYNVVVVEDCVSSRKESDKKTALKRLQSEGVLLTSYESILFELCRTADAQEFKTISKLVK